LTSSSSHHHIQSKGEHHQQKYDFFKEFNSKNAKIIACFIVCGFVLYHSVLRLFHGKDEGTGTGTGGRMTYV
jgi:hypothetical protein